MSRERFVLDFDAVESLLPRYTQAGPRYTSYPTAPVWKHSYSARSFRRDLASIGTDRSAGLSLYAHVPFCRSLCHFCACNRVITRNAELPERYLDVIAREVAAVREAVPDPPSATQLHWGGGTPTHLRPDQIRRLFAILVDAFPMREGAEISIEVDPRVTGIQHVEVLRECGFNRISLGVQDLEPRVQEAIHRIQPEEQTATLVDQARAAGFESANVDLIYGLPYQSVESFGRTLDAILGIDPDRIALYSYAHVTWLAKQQRGFERKDLPDPATKVRIMLSAIRRFLENGYEYIGLDHFAKPEDELVLALEDRTLRRNFMGYTTQAGVDLIAFGPSAISELRGSYAQNERDLASWQQAVTERGIATMRGHDLSEDDLRRAWIIARIMSHGELRASEYAETFGEDFAEHYRPELERLDPLVRDGLVVRDADGSLRATSLGRLLVRNIAMAFDAYLPEQQKAEQPLFSKTV